MRLRQLSSLSTIAFVIWGAACGGDESSSRLQPLDFELPKGSEAEFDRNDILSTAALTDVDAVDAEGIRVFLAKTPYERPSFLATYQSNGVPAAEAIARAARQYRINPIVLLVYVQAVQGLIGERDYPSAPSQSERVEYLFRCGCIQAGNCLPEFAGFDRQIDCLGRALRVSLDEIAEKETTSGAWGPGKTSTTIDGDKVSPSDEATAVVYDRTPRINYEREGGTWMIWNLFTHYAMSLNYSSTNGGVVGGGWIGDECKSDTSCGYEGATCADNYEGGYCTLPCSGQCPTKPDAPEAICVAFDDGGFCFRVCNPGAPACRPGYQCTLLRRYKGATPNDAMHVCYPPR